MSQPGIDPWGVAAAPAAPADPWGTAGDEPFGEDEAKGALNLAATGAQVTSQKRSRADNTRVGGVPNSMHLSGQAMDFVLPHDTDQAAVRAELERQGYPITEWLIEKKGDPHSTGDHIHWGWAAKGSVPATASNANVDPWGVAPTAATPPRQMPEQGQLPGKLFLNPSIAPSVPKGAPRPFAPGEYVANPNGSWSSEISVTVTNPNLNGGRATILPSLWVVNGKPVRVSEDRAADYARKSGLTFPSYNSIAEAEKAANARESAWEGLTPQTARSVPPLWQSQAPEASWAEILSPNVASAWDRIKRAGVGLGQWAFNEAMPEITPEERANPKFKVTPQRQAALEKTRASVNGWIAKAGADIATDLKANSPNLDPGTAKATAYQWLAGLTDMVPALAATAITKNPELGAAIIAGQSGGEKYADALANGRSRDQAAMDASFSALTNGAMSLLPLNVFMKPGGTFMAKTLRNAGAFGLQSVVTEALQIGYDKGLVTPNMTLKEALGRIEQAGITGTLSGALLGGGHHAFESAVNRFRAQPTPPQPRAEPTFGTEQPNAARPGNGPAASAQADIGLTTPGRPPEPDPWAPAPDQAKPFRTTPANIADEHALEVARLEREAAETAARSTAPARPPTDEFTDFLNRQGVIPGEGSEAPVPPSKTYPRDETELAKDEFWGASKPPPPIEINGKPLTFPQKPEPRAALPEGDGIPRRALEADTAITASGREVPVRYAVVEASHLVPSQTQEGSPNPNYPQELQPRDRTRAVSQAQIASIAQNINPRLLGPSVSAADGAPIISASGIVESGNGRTLAIQRAYGGDMASAQAYRDHLASEGYPVEGMTAPVLVRIREGEMTPEDRQAFVHEANQSAQLGHSATERAMTDAAAMPEHVLDLYRGGDVDSVANRDFVRTFMRTAIPTNEHAGMIDQHGGMSAQATQRVRAALLAKAYGDPDMVARIIESPDDSIKAIGGAMGDVAADWARMRARANEGSIPDSLDQTPKLLEAVNLVRRARDEGHKLFDLLAQRDIFSGDPVDPDVEAWLRLMFRNTKDWTKPVGREKLADALRFYATEAQKAQVGPDLLGNKPVEAGDVLATARAKQEAAYAPAAETRPSLLAREDVRARGGYGAGGGPEGAETPGSPGLAEDRAQGPLRNGYGPVVHGFSFEAPAGPTDRNQPLIRDLDEFFQKSAASPKDVHSAVGALANYILGRGRQYGVESVGAWSPDGGGKIYASTTNEKAFVSFGGLDEFLRQPQSRLVTLHNHPSGTAPSFMDFGSLGLPGHAVMAVVPHTGGWHAHRLVARFDPSADTDARIARITGIAKAADDAILPILQDAVNRRVLAPDTAWRLHRRIANEAMDRAGMTEYLSSDHLEDESNQPLIRQALKASIAAAKGMADANGLRIELAPRTDGVYRPAEPLRFTDGVAKLLGQPAENAEQPAGIAGAGTGAGLSRAPYRKPEQLRLLEDENRYERDRPVFYSALTRAIDESKMSRAPAKDWLGFIDNLQSKGVKSEEVDWSGIREWLKGETGPVTREKVLDHLRANEVRVQEVLKNTDAHLAPHTFVAEKRASDGEWIVRDTRNGRIEGVYTDADAAKEGAERNNSYSVDETKFSDYALPGGDNYRELLLTLPARAHSPAEISATAKDLARKQGDDWDSLGPNGRQSYEDQARVELNKQTGVFKSGHWNEPNVLAHIRFDDRTGPDGEKVLHILEIQSDWAQRGRREGFKHEPSPNPPGWAVAGDASVNGRGVPDMPFKSTESWAGLAIKRALRYAVEHGYDKLTFDTGETQADRYDLSKQISELGARRNEDGTYGLNVRTPDGMKTVGVAIPKDKLADHVGKDMADKIIGQKEDLHRYIGLDLKVGGEGMKGFYDRILPQFLSKYVKKWGARVRKSELATGPMAEERVPVHEVSITPAMRESVMGGQALFEDENRYKDMFATEPGAVDAKGRALPQTVIPGAEKSAAQLAKAREAAGHGLKTTKATQKEAGPLFGPGEGAGGGGQGSLFEEENRYGLPDGYRFVEGKGSLGAGRWGVKGPDGNLVWNYHDSKEEAARSAVERLKAEELTANRQRGAAERDQQIANAIRSGQNLSESDLTHLGLRASGSEFPYLSPVVQRLFGISKAKVRLAMGDSLKERYSNTGAKFYVADPRKALRNAADYAARNAISAPRSDQGSLFETPNPLVSARPLANLGRTLREGAANAMDLVHDAQMLLAPMAEGSSVARATAKTFANMIRLGRWHGQRMDELLKKGFTPAQRRKMWEAADQESVARQQGQPTAGIGLSTLTPEERRAVLEQQQDAQNVWKAAQDLGMVSSEGLPSYVPRMMVEVADTGVRQLGSGPDSLRSIPGIGRNLRTKTSQMLRRRHLTSEETEAAGSAKFDTAANIVKDIRTLPLATARLREAVAGRALINKIKDVGRATGDDTVVEGNDPSRGNDRWFHLNHPSFFTWRPKFIRDPETGEYVVQKDQNGDAVLEKTPLWVRGDFEGPLKAVLTHGNDSLWYRGLMDLKGRAMTTIMYSPLIHNAVEWGRALPAMPGKVLTMRVYFEGNAAKRNPETMTEAITHGLVPIGHQGGFQDITSIATADNIKAGRSWTAKALGAIPGLFDPRAKEAVYRAIDRMGDIWHNTLLWDRVGDLQMGLYTNLRDQMIHKGYAPDTAQYVAAHFANRYAGALPQEAMSTMSRKIANLLLFSRTYTLGNLGAMKDVFTGLPRDVQAQIEQSGGELGKVKSLARRKALGILITDIALFYAANSLLQSGIAYISKQKDLSEIEKGYVDRLIAEGHRIGDNPLELLNPFGALQNLSATSENEAGREDRVFVGTDHNGTAIYARNPVGKIGEEFKNWLTQPLDTFKKKLGTLARPTYEVLTNDAGFGRHVYDPNAKGAAGLAQNVGHIVSTYMGAQVPLDSLKSAYNLATGKASEIDTYKTLGPLAGVTFSKGAPGGPAVGYAYQLEREHQAKVQAGMPDVIEKIKNGDVQGARTDMKALGVSPGLANWYVRTTLNPKLKMNTRKMREMLRSATPQERARLQELRGATP